MVPTLLGLAACAAAVPTAMAALGQNGLPVGIRIHRLILPAPETIPVVGPAPTPQPPPPVVLPRSLSIDEVEFALKPSQIRVAAGQVMFNVYNRGMDDHDLAVYASTGKLVQRVDVPSGGMKTMSPALAAGDYRVICSYFAGTSQSHEDLGMKFILTVANP